MQQEKAKATKLSNRGRPDKAARLMREVIANRQRASGEAMLDDYMMLALFLFNAGEIEETVEVLEQAASLFPEQPEIYENLGVTLGRLGRNDGAIENLETALSLGSTRPLWSSCASYRLRKDDDVSISW